MHAFSPEHESIRFGEFELDPRSGELRKSGVLVKLQPQPLRVLVLLASNPGKLVTREEIQQAIWEGVTFVDFEHGLNFCIKQIRVALGDNAQAPCFIETLPRRGYRFIAAVDENSNNTTQVVASAAPIDSTSPQPLKASIEEHQLVPRAGSRVARAAVIAIVPLLIVGGYFAWRFLARSPVPTRGKVMLGVMPFENLSGDPEQEYFSDGMTEELIAQLGSLQPGKLGVIARTSAMTYKLGNRDIRQIGRELKIDYVLEGSVRREGDRVRITAQLIQVSDQTHLWSESYERSTPNTLAVQIDVARNIARALALKLIPAERSAESIPPEGTITESAYDAFLKGRYLWNKGRSDDVEKSIDFYNQALALAPGYAIGYAPALAGLADSYILLGMYYTIPPKDAYSKAKSAATRAIELDDRLAEAHTAMGTILFRFDWNWPAAEAEFKRAIELNPSYGRAHHDYAWLLVALERFDEALNEIKRAQELDPLSPLANSDVGWVYLRARHYDDAISQIERTLQLEPEFASAQACLERAYRLKGMNKEAVDSARKSMIRSGATPGELAGLDKGDPQQAMRSVLLWRLKKSEETARNRPASPYRLAAQHAELGNKDAAFEWLERAFNERDSELVSLKVDPAFDDVRSDSRYLRLLQSIGL